MTSPITLMTETTERLGPALRAEIIEVCVAAHQEEDFRNLFAYVPAGGRHFLAFDGARLVSHAVVTERWLQQEGLPLLRTAYVDAVATLPAAQGKGYGSALMQHLAAGVPDFEIACLETDRSGFYERLGWEAWRGPLAGRNESGLVPTPQQTGIMILRLKRTPALEFERGLTIECQGGRIW